MNNLSKSSEIDLPIGIGKPASRALESAGITKLTDFTQVSEAELLKLHGVGPKALRIISTALEDHGLNFALKENSDNINDRANQNFIRRG